MSNTFHISPERLQPAGMSAAMAALQRGFTHFGIDFYVVGAVARDIWMSQVYHEPERRMTKDLDLAVFINNTAEYEALQAWLIAHENFTLTRHSAFCLHYHAPGSPVSVAVDLMPFGAIADEAGDVYLTGRGMERISTVGFMEVLAEAATLTTEAGEQWRVVTLPGIAVLKFIAWQDRPEKRGKDATDVWNLVEGYFNLIAADIYAQHLDLFDENETATPTNFMLLVGARVLGRQMGQLLAAGPVQTRVLALLADQLALGERSPLAKALSQPGAALSTCLQVLGALHTGLTDAWPIAKSS